MKEGKRLGSSLGHEKGIGSHCTPDDNVWGMIRSNLTHKWAWNKQIHFLGEEGKLLFSELSYELPHHGWG